MSQPIQAADELFRLIFEILAVLLNQFLGLVGELYALLDAVTEFLLGLLNIPQLFVDFAIHSPAPLQGAKPSSALIVPTCATISR